MVNPVPGYSVQTKYGVSGDWSCGFHTGVDIPAPKGTQIVAAIAGQIRHRNYGSDLGYHQFAISPDPGQPFAEGEVFYAHTYDRPADGIYVKIGDPVAHVGSEGRSSGPHLHFEYHPSEKNSWGCNICSNPQVVLDHGGSSSGGGGGGGGVYKTVHVYSDKVGMGEPTNGDSSSDTVNELIYQLNNVSLQGGQELPYGGRYDAEVDEEVRLWQAQVCGDTPDPPGQSYLGPNQFAKMFPSSSYTRHDVGLPAIASDGGSGGSGGGSGGGGGGGGSGNLPAAPALMLPNAVWNPITNFPGLRPFKGTAKKITLHTTETSAKPNWEAQQKGIPHLTVNLKTKERWQHLDFGIAAYTLNGGDHSPNSDSGQNIQIEIIGYTRDCPNWSQAEYSELEGILEWLCNNVHIPFEFPLLFTLPVRCTWNQWEPVSGIVGHCHAPYNDHTDPTGLRTDLIVPPPVTPEPEPPAEEYVTKKEWDEFRNSVAVLLQEIIELL